MLFDYGSAKVFWSKGLGPKSDKQFWCVVLSLLLNVSACFWNEGEALTKIDIINLVAEDTGLSKVKAEEAVETIIATIKGTLQQGESIILRRFGSFQVRAKKARIGRNPKTGEEAPISARKVVRFKSGKHFKEAMNGEPVRFF